MIAAGFSRRLWRNEAGAAMLEFAILGPAMLMMLFGVLQVGLGLQNYNALRSISADVSRYAMIQYATGNAVSNDLIKSQAETIATKAPYMLKSVLRVTVTDVATSSVTGAQQKALTIQYQIPSLLGSMGIKGLTISYSRPLFLAPTA